MDNPWGSLLDDVRYILAAGPRCVDCDNPLSSDGKCHDPQCMRNRWKELRSEAYWERLKSAPKVQESHLKTLFALINRDLEDPEMKADYVQNLLDSIDVSDDDGQDLYDRILGLIPKDVKVKPHWKRGVVTEPVFPSSGPSLESLLSDRKYTERVIRKYESFYDDGTKKLELSVNIYGSIPDYRDNGKLYTFHETFTEDFSIDSTESIPLDTLRRRLLTHQIKFQDGTTGESINLPKVYKEIIFSPDWVQGIVDDIEGGAKLHRTYEDVIWETKYNSARESVDLTIIADLRITTRDQSTGKDFEKPYSLDRTVRFEGIPSVQDLKGSFSDFMFDSEDADGVPEKIAGTPEMWNRIFSPARAKEIREAIKNNFYNKGSDTSKLPTKISPTSESQPESQKFKGRRPGEPEKYSPEERGLEITDVKVSFHDQAKVGVLTVSFVLRGLMQAGSHKFKVLSKVNFKVSDPIANTDALIPLVQNSEIQFSDLTTGEKLKSKNPDFWKSFFNTSGGQNEAQKVLGIIFKNLNPGAQPGELAEFLGVSESDATLVKARGRQEGLKQLRKNLTEKLQAGKLSPSDQQNLEWVVGLIGPEPEAIPKIKRPEHEVEVIRRKPIRSSALERLARRLLS